ncbi:hypothetical protein ACFU99_11050 [Streptomyces sp. NPDC057654]|uniref:DUF7848 domain-containing protein n=1 Tax=Streptomyces sp. NPDC057654 TaxID=3346196 RepID=UPI00369DB7C2
MKSVARAELARMMGEQGTDGVLLLRKEGRRAGPPRGGGIAFPPCQCAEHRAGQGKPDTAIRLGDKGGRNEVLVARPAYSVVCLAHVGDDATCGAQSGEHGTADAISAWLRQHADATGHRRYRRTRSERLTLDAPAPRRATRHCVGIAEMVAGP